MTDASDNDATKSAIWELMGLPQNFRPVRLGETIKDSDLLRPIRVKLFNYGFNYIRDIVDFTADKLLQQVQGLTRDEIIYLQLYLLHSRLSLATPSETVDPYYRELRVGDEVRYNITDEKILYNEKTYGDERIPNVHPRVYEDRSYSPTGWRSTFGQDPGGEPL